MCAASVALWARDGRTEETESPRFDIFIPNLIPLSVRLVAPRFSDLPKVRFVSGPRECSVRLYADDGSVDEHAASAIDEALADVRVPGKPHVVAIDRRLLQLVVKVATHFGATQVDVVSAYRKPGRTSEGHHAKGRALDFRLPDVSAKELATYLRAQPRVGVGQYIHPRTQYVHLDVREVSYHWLDGTGPHRAGGEWRLATMGLPRLDASYSPELDLPEGMTAFLEESASSEEPSTPATHHEHADAD